MLERNVPTKITRRNSVAGIFAGVLFCGLVIFLWFAGTNFCRTK